MLKSYRCSNSSLFSLTNLIAETLKLHVSELMIHYTSIYSLINLTNTHIASTPAPSSPVALAVLPLESRSRYMPSLSEALQSLSVSLVFSIPSFQALSNGNNEDNNNNNNMSTPLSVCGRSGTGNQARPVLSAHSAAPGTLHLAQLSSNCPLLLTSAYPPPPPPSTRFPLSTPSRLQNRTREQTFNRLRLSHTAHREVASQCTCKNQLPASCPLVIAFGLATHQYINRNRHPICWHLVLWSISETAIHYDWLVLLTQQLELSDQDVHKLALHMTTDAIKRL